jgi:hypothetical protein
MAFDIAAVSPFFKASNILNFRTVCSIDIVLSGDKVAVVREWTLEADLLSPDVLIDFFEEWPRGVWDVVAKFMGWCAVVVGDARG